MLRISSQCSENGGPKKGKRKKKKRNCRNFQWCILEGLLTTRWHMRRRRLPRIGQEQPESYKLKHFPNSVSGEKTLRP